MKDIKKLLGKKIKELRKKKNWTQEHLAEIIDVDQRTLSAIECGTNFPTKHFVKIAEVFSIELKDLFDFEHLEINDKYMKQETKKIIDKLNSRDLTIIYRLLKIMLL